MESPRYARSWTSPRVEVILWGIGGAGFAAWIARERWRVRAPWPVPASRISNGEISALDSEGGETCISRRETMRFASPGYICLFGQLNCDNWSTR
jgi:hypothetical protein